VTLTSSLSALDLSAETCPIVGIVTTMPAPALRAVTMLGATAPFGVLPPPRNESFSLK
jgi:hypothetical protein